MKRRPVYPAITAVCIALSFLFSGMLACATEAAGPDELSVLLRDVLQQEGMEGLREALSTPAFTSDADRHLRSLAIVRDLSRLEEKRRLEALEAFQQSREEFEDRLAAGFPEKLDAVLEIIRLRSEIEAYRTLPSVEYTPSGNLTPGLLDWLETRMRRGEWEETDTDWLPWLGKWMPPQEPFKDLLSGWVERANVIRMMDSWRYRQERKDQETDLIKTIENAFMVLDSQYLKKPDYSQIRTAIFDRCRLIGDLLETSGSRPDLTGRTPNIPRWTERISQRQHQPVNSPDSRDSIMALLAQLNAENADCLGLPREFFLQLLLDAACSQLDTYTCMVWPWDVDEFKKSMFQEYVGIGVALKKDKTNLIVRDVYPNSPASNSSLRPDDIILEIEGKPTKPMSLQAAVSSLTKPQPSQVSLKVLNPDTEETRHLTIPKQQIVLPSVYTFRLNDPDRLEQALFCIRITQFNNSTAREFRQAASDIERNGVDGLILDLRSNTGGVLSAALEIADMYVDRGVMLIGQPRHGPASYYSATGRSSERDYPLVVLLDGLTASSAEVLAGILRNSASDRVLLVGENSYGKTCIQAILPLLDGQSLLKFTHAEYRFPASGKADIARKDQPFFSTKGLHPDIAVSLFPHEKSRVEDFYRVSNLYCPLPDVCKTVSTGKIYSTDPQMMVGCHILQLLLL